MNHLQRLVLISCFIGHFQVPAYAESVDKLPKPASYVNDFAGVCDPQSTKSMEELAGQVAAKAHATIVVVTVKSLEGSSIEEFTTALEDKWKVGPKGTDKGVLMVFAIQDRKRRIEVGYGLEGILNDAKVGDIGRSMVPDLKAGQYGAGALLGVQQLANVIAADAGVTLTAPAQTPQAYRREPVRRHSTNWVGLILFLAVVLFSLHGRGGRGGRNGLLWFFLGGLLGGGRSRGGGGFGGSGSGGGGGSGGDFDSGFGGDSGGGGASGDW